MKTATAAWLIGMIISEATAVREEEKKANGKNGGKVDARQASIQAVFDSKSSDGGPFGCSTPYVAKLVSAMTGLDIKVKSTSSHYPPQFAVVVPIEEMKSSHDHPANKPAMNMSPADGYALDIDSLPKGHGASYNTLRKDWVRPATDEEFSAYIEALKANPDKAAEWLHRTLGMNHMFPKN